MPIITTAANGSIITNKPRMLIKLEGDCANSNFISNTEIYPVANKINDKKRKVAL